MTALGESAAPWLVCESANARRSLDYPELSAWWPELCEVDPGVDPLEVARACQQRALIDEWDARPTDPEEDVAELLVGYPSLASAFQTEAAEIKADPIYQVACRAGEHWRRELLAVAALGPWDEYAAAEFFEDQLCECELRGLREWPDGSPIFRRHRDAARCRWCVIRRVLEVERHAENLASSRGCSVEEARREVEDADASGPEFDWEQW